MSNFFGPGGSSAGSQVATIVSLSQNQDCNSYRITELGEPVLSSDAATKGYVDTHGGGPGGSPSLNQVLTQGNNAFNNSIQNVGELSLSTLSSASTSAPFQISVSDNLDLGGSYKITNLANATSSGDAVNLNTLTNQLGGYVKSSASDSIQMNGFNVTNAAVVSSYKFKSADSMNQAQIWFTGGPPLSNSLLKIGPADQSNYSLQCDINTGITNIVQANVDTLSNITGNPINCIGGLKVDRIIDRNNSGGSSGNVLTAGGGGELLWQPGGGSVGGVHSVQPGSGVTVSGDPQNPVVSANVAQIQAGSNVSVSNVSGTYTISATAATGGVSSISSSNPGITIANPTSSSPVLTPKYIGAATFQFDNTTPASGVTTAPGGSITIWYTPLTPLATSILKEYYTGLPNLALQIKYTPSIYVQGFAQGNADYLYFDVITDAGGQSPGADNNRVLNNIQDFPVSCDFQLTTQTNNGFSNANNTKVGLVIQNGCTNGGAGIFMTMIPNVIRFDVFDPSNFS